MTTSATYVRNILKSCIELKLRGVITKPISKTNFVKNTKKLRLEGLIIPNGSLELDYDFIEFDRDFIDLDNDCLDLNRDCLDLDNGFIDLDNDFIGLDNDFISLDNDFIDLDNDFISLDNDFIELDNGSLGLNRFLAFLRSIILVTFCYLLKYKQNKIKPFFKIKYSIYNVTGFHFNLDFINFHILRQLFIIFKLLFNQKHQYWYESNYFS